MSYLRTFIRHTCYRASISSNPRPVYSRLYEVFLIRPDGSSIRIKHPEPVSILKLPIDINKLSEEDRKKALQRRQMSIKGKKQVDDHFNFDNTTKVNFDPRKYIKKK